MMLGTLLLFRLRDKNGQIGRTRLAMEAMQREHTQTRRQLEALQIEGRMGFWEWDPKTDRIIFSDGLLALLGVRSHEGKGDLDTLLGFVDPRARHALDDAVTALRTTGTQTLHHALLCRDGTLLPTIHYLTADPSGIRGGSSMRFEIRRRTILLLAALLLLPPAPGLLFRGTVSTRIPVDAPLDAPFLDAVPRSTILLYFGYVGCGDVCTPLLGNLAALYDAEPFAALRAHVGVAFANLTYEIDPEQPALFAMASHPAFIGIHLDRSRLQGLSRLFRLYYARRLGDPRAMDHTDFVYLLQRKGGGYRLVSFYSTHPLDGGRLRADIAALLKESP